MTAATTPPPADVDVIDVASLPLTERMLLAAEVMTGGDEAFLGETLRLMAQTYRSAALRTQEPALRAHLDANARECRWLAQLIVLAQDSCRMLGPGVSLGAGALFVSRAVGEEAANPTYGPEAREELERAHARATALVNHLADVEARRRPS